MHDALIDVGFVIELRWDRSHRPKAEMQPDGPIDPIHWYGNDAADAAAGAAADLIRVSDAQCKVMADSDVPFQLVLIVFWLAEVALCLGQTSLRKPSRTCSCLTRCRSWI